MSSFRRATPSAAAPTGTTPSAVHGFIPATVKRSLPGTKPFLNGQTLVSTGLAQLDTIVGGGWLLGTLVLLDVPRNDAAAASAALVDDFQRYFLAEGVVSGHCAVLASEEAAAFATHQLPLELSLAQKQVKAQLAAMDVANGDPAKTDEDGEPLTIAWQYQKYLADASGSKQRFCHSFDLSRAIHPELLEANPPVLLDIVDYTLDASASVQDIYTRLLADVEREIQQRSSTQVTRVSVRELGSPLFGPATHEHMRAVFGFLKSLRRIAAASRNVVFHLSGHLYAFPVEFANEVRHLSDYVLEVKSFSGESDMLPGELVEFHGLLDIKRLARVHALACHSLDAVKYGIKRERRKMKIEKFHLPPEGSRSSNDKDKKSKAKGSSTSSTSSSSSSAGSNLVSSSFVRKKPSAVGCGSSSGGSSGFDPLDF